jgi:hypothetical protein
MKHFVRFIKVLFLGMGLSVLIGCFRTSILPLPALLFNSPARMKPSSTLEIPVTLYQGGESKDTREYTLSVTPSEVNGISANFIQTKIRFESSVSLRVVTPSNILPGIYGGFTVSATAGSDVFSAQVFVIVE